MYRKVIANVGTLGKKGYWLHIMMRCRVLFYKISVKELKIRFYGNKIFIKNHLSCILIPIFLHTWQDGLVCNNLRKGHEVIPN